MEARWKLLKKLDWIQWAFHFHHGFKRAAIGWRVSKGKGEREVFFCFSLLSLSYFNFFLSRPPSNIQEILKVILDSKVNNSIFFSMVKHENLRKRMFPFLFIHVFTLFFIFGNAWNLFHFLRAKVISISDGQ